MKNFSQRLRELMSRKQISEKDLAEAIGKSAATVGHYVRKVRTPSEDVANQIADFFQLKGDERELFLALAAVTHVRDPGLVSLLIRLVYQSHEVAALRDERASLLADNERILADNVELRSEVAALRDAIKARL